MQDLVIYAGGSGQDGHIGAAIYSLTLNMTKNEYIGTEDTHNVYAAEVTAIQMVVFFFEEKIEEYSKVYIVADNQAAIQAIESPNGNPDVGVESMQNLFGEHCSGKAHSSRYALVILTLWYKFEASRFSA